MPLAPDILTGLARRLAEHAGLELPAWVVEARAQARMGLCGLSPAEYLALVESPRGASELAELIELVRVGETRLFRHLPQIEALTELVPPVAKGKRTLRVWSAGCATGEEPYTLAVVLSKLLPACEVSILATDVSEDALAVGRAGCYPAGAIDRVPRAWRDGFVVDDRGLTVRPEIARLVTFEQHNLIDERRESAGVGATAALPLGRGRSPRGIDERRESAGVGATAALPLGRGRSPRGIDERRESAGVGATAALPLGRGRSPRGIDETRRRSFDLVWCRNVLIYFEAEARRRVVERLVAAVEVGGLLFVGYSETLRDVAQLEAVRPGAYAKRAGVPPVRRTPVSGVPIASPSPALSTPTSTPPPTPSGRWIAVKRDCDVADVAREISAVLGAKQRLTVEVDEDAPDELAPVLRRARAAGLALAIVGATPGARRWLQRHRLEDEA